MIGDDVAVLVLDLVSCIWPRDHVMVPLVPLRDLERRFTAYLPRYCPWSVAARQLQQLTPR